LFNLPTQRKQRVLQTLQLIIDDLKQNKIDVVEDVFVSAPHGYSLGFASMKTADFFGVSFHRLDRKEKEKAEEKEVLEEKEKKKIMEGPAGIIGEEPRLPAAPLQIQGPKGPSGAMPEKQKAPETKHKITDRECENYKKGKDYLCPCTSFSSESIVGFKIHFNRCQDKPN